MKSKLNPVNTGSPQRAAEGVKEVPCYVNPVALLRVLSLAKLYVEDHPDVEEQFKNDIEACTVAGEIYTAVWNVVNRSDT